MGPVFVMCPCHPMAQTGDHACYQRAGYRHPPGSGPKKVKNRKNPNDPMNEQQKQSHSLGSSSPSTAPQGHSPPNAGGRQPCRGAPTPTVGTGASPAWALGRTGTLPATGEGVPSPRATACMAASPSHPDPSSLVCRFANISISPWRRRGQHRRGQPGQSHSGGSGHRPP